MSIKYKIEGHEHLIKDGGSKLLSIQMLRISTLYAKKTE